MSGIEIVSLIVLIAFAIFIFPRAKHALKHSRKAEKGEWLNALLPIALVALFVILLIKSV